VGRTQHPAGILVRRARKLGDKDAALERITALCEVASVVERDPTYTKADLAEVFDGVRGEIATLTKRLAAAFAKEPPEKIGRWLGRVFVQAGKLAGPLVVNYLVQGPEPQVEGVTTTKRGPRPMTQKEFLKFLETAEKVPPPASAEPSSSPSKRARRKAAPSRPR
jgi:hypothetical protein